MESDKKIYVDNVKVRLSIVNHKLIDSLVSLGIRQAKSLKLKFPNVPEEFLSHFTRGYIDGDGSIDKSKNNPRLRILGTLEFLISMRNQISASINIPKNKPHQKGNIYVLNYNGKTAIKVLDWSYKDASIYLERKYNKYMEFKK